MGSIDGFELPNWTFSNYPLQNPRPMRLVNFPLVAAHNPPSQAKEILRFLDSGWTFECKNGHNHCQSLCLYPRAILNVKKICSMLPGSLYWVVTRSCYFGTLYTYKMYNYSCSLFYYPLLYVLPVTVFCSWVKQGMLNSKETESRWKKHFCDMKLK